MSVEQGPPDLFELLKKLFSNATSTKKTTNSTTSTTSSIPPMNIIPIQKWVGFGVAFLILMWILLGIFIVSPAERAVVLRFGKYVETLDAGPHWIPPLIEKRYVLNTQAVRNFPYRSEMLTTDENIVSVAVAVQYRIFDAKDYLFNVVNPVRSLQQATSSALRQVVGQMTLDDILTKGRQQLRDRVADQLNVILKIYNTGLEVTDLTLQPAKPPEEVTAAFDDAIKAREDEQRYVNQAQAYVQQVTSIVKGQVARLIQSAKAYQQSVILQAQGQTARFLALLHVYQQSPEVTRERLYLENMQSVLTQTHNVIVDAGNNNMMYLPLDQLMKQRVETNTKSSSIELTPRELSKPTTSVESDTIRPSYPDGENS